jgi:hypothetical protein
VSNADIYRSLCWLLYQNYAGDDDEDEEMGDPDGEGDEDEDDLDEQVW